MASWSNLPHEIQECVVLHYINDTIATVKSLYDTDRDGEVCLAWADSQLKGVEDAVFILRQALLLLSVDVMNLIKSKAAASRQDAHVWWRIGMTEELSRKYAGGEKELVVERSVVERLARVDYSQSRLSQEEVVSRAMYEFDLD